MASSDVAVPTARRRPRTSADLSAQLRTRTRRAHLAVEAAFALDARLTDPLAYGALLARLRGYFAKVEDALATVTGWDELLPPLDIGSRRRTPLLDADLRQLGIDVPRVPEQYGGPGIEPLAPDSLARGLGCLYVLEGSALGGRIVSRRAQAALGEQLPVAFFSSAGRGDLGGQWRELKAALNAFQAQHGSAAGQQVVAAAYATFASLTAWLDVASIDVASLDVGER